VRIVAATHRALSERVASGEFCADLFYHLNILDLALPPLRERASDIAGLASHLLVLTGHVHSIDAARDALEPVLPMLGGYRWPGNVRELQNVIERIAVELEESPGARVSWKLLKSLAPELERDAAAGSETLKARSRKLEADEIRTMLDSFDGDRDKTSRALGISKTTLWRKLGAR
jgi:propionate catabolism operon transcriptional regulator